MQIPGMAKHLIFLKRAKTDYLGHRSHRAMTTVEYGVWLISNR
jgi:hypothetical protein